MFERLSQRVPFWLLLTVFFLFLGFAAESWIARLATASLSTASISGLISAHLSEWKTDKFRMF